MEDYSARQRYQERRRAIERRRRRRAATLLALMAVLLGAATTAIVLRPSLLSPVASPAATPHTVPQAAATGTPAVVAIVGPTTYVPGLPTATPQAALSQLLDRQRLTYAPDFYAPQIEAFLQEKNSPLLQVQFQVGDRVHSFAEVLVGQSSLYSVSPKVVLAILELQSRAVTSASAADLQWAAGFRGNEGRNAGLYAQLLWLIRELHHAQRDYGGATTLLYGDDTTGPVPQGLSMAEYALARVLARTVSPAGLGPLLGDGPRSFLTTYTALFGDPRPLLPNLPPPAAPFMVRPTEQPFPIASFFDHDAPFLQQNGSLTTYWGVADGDVAYDGHDGWDYAVGWPNLALATAAGTVVFAGNSDDGCATPARAVIVDHGNGYRTLYWHLSEVNVRTGQQVAAAERLGMIGNSGCARGEHLHLQAQYLGRDTDPFGWCGAGTDPWAAHPAGNTSTWLWADRPAPCGSEQPGTIIADNDGPEFTAIGDRWQQATPGYGGATLVAGARPSSDTAAPWELGDPAMPPVALWQTHLPQSGRYRVLAYVPFVAGEMGGLPSFAPFRWSSTATSQQVRYIVGHNSGQSEVMIDQALFSNDWADLGVYDFDAQSRPYVALSALGSLPDYGVWADAVAWIPVK